MHYSLTQKSTSIKLPSRYNIYKIITVFVNADISNNQNAQTWKLLNKIGYRPHMESYTAIKKTKTKQ